MTNWRGMVNDKWLQGAVVAVVSFGGPLLAGCDKHLLSKPAYSPGAPAANLKSAAMGVITAALDDRSPQVRANAVEAVAATGRMELMPKVSLLLKDDYVPVRFAAFCAVGDMRYRGATATLRMLLDADPDENCRLAAVYALTKTGAADSMKMLVDATTSRDMTVRANAVVLLGKSGDKRVLDVVYAAKDAEDSDMAVRIQAAEAIARLGDERMYPKLWTLLISKYTEDRIIGIRAMGAMGTADGKNAIITMLDDEVVEVRLAAAGQLGALGEKMGEPEVLDVFRNNLTAGMSRQESERVRIMTAFAIGAIRSEALGGYLGGLLKDSSQAVRLAAAQAVLKYD
jgi:HEAT repeat protein